MSNCHQHITPGNTGDRCSRSSPVHRTERNRRNSVHGLVLLFSILVGAWCGFELLLAEPTAAAPNAGQQKQPQVTKPDAKAAPASASHPDAKKKASSVAPDLQMDFSRQPTYVKSNSLTLLSEQRTFAYVGDVEVRQGDMVITTGRLDGQYSEQNEIQTLTATGDVYITKGADVHARGEKAIYNKATESLVLTDSPELQRDKSVLTADKITIFLKENRSIAEGKVRMKLTKPEGANDKNLLPMGNK